MKIRRVGINTFLLLFLALHIAACKTDEEKKRDKELTSLQVCLAAEAPANDRGSAVAIGRTPLMYVKLEKSGFLDTGDILRARLVDNIDKVGGWAIAVQFDSHGTLLLDSMTSRYKGMHLAIMLGAKEERWVAAPLINHRITNGYLVFTPEATREEAERYVRGLNNIAKKIHKDDLVP